MFTRRRVVASEISPALWNSTLNAQCNFPNRDLLRENKRYNIQTLPPVGEDVVCAAARSCVQIYGERVHREETRVWCMNEKTPRRYCSPSPRQEEPATYFRKAAPPFTVSTYFAFMTSAHRNRVHLNIIRSTCLRRIPRIIKTLARLPSLARGKALLACVSGGTEVTRFERVDRGQRRLIGNHEQFASMNVWRPNHPIFLKGDERNSPTTRDYSPANRDSHWEKEFR